jgi:predicted deacetylase
VNDDPGMMKLTAQSEFAGLSRAEQAEKLRQGLAIFEANGVRADAWVAPSHSFDSVTVELLRELGVPVISDGLWPNAFMDKRGTLWIPQQLWQFKRKGGGVWTVCQHHNSWSKRELDYFLSKLRTFAEHMTSVAHVADQTSRVGPEFTERVSAYCNWAWNHRIRPWLSQYRHKRNARLQLGAE